MYKKILFTILAVVVILAGVSGLVGYIWQQQTNPGVNLTSNPFKLPPIPNNLQNNPDEISTPPLPPVPEPSVVNSYTGEIIELAADKLVISTNRGNKTVKFNANTIFEKIFVPKFPALPPLPGSANNQLDEVVPDPEVISPQELESGQNAQVYTDANISGQTEFTADKISLVIRLDN